MIAVSRGQVDVIYGFVRGSVDEIGWRDDHRIHVGIWVVFFFILDRRGAFDVGYLIETKLRFLNNL